MPSVYFQGLKVGKKTQYNDMFLLDNYMHIHAYTQACKDNHKVKYRFILNSALFMFLNL